MADTSAVGAAPRPPAHRRLPWWVAPSLPLVLLLTVVMFAAGFLLKAPCRSIAWSSADTQYRVGCYSDIPLLYLFRGFADGQRPYLDPPAADGRYLEYPVLTGAVMAVTSWLVGTEGTASERMVRFYDITAILLLLFALLTVAAVWSTRPRGPTAALMVALSPALLLTATINWDLIAVAFTALAVFAWSRQAFWWTGVFVGLGAAAKFYPLFLLGPVLVLVLHRVLAQRRGRDGDLPAWPAGPGVVLLRVLVASVLTWAAINLPVAVANRDGWLEFYTFSQDRGIDFGSPWLAMSFLDWWTVPSETANLLGGGLFLLLCAAIGVLGLLSPRPSLAQLALLVVAAFAITNKVYSPQYVLWLLPLAALARPRWPLFLAWQAAEAVYWAGVWRFLLGYGRPEASDGALSFAQYSWVIWVHVAMTVVFSAAVAYDIARGRPGGDDPAAEVAPPTPATPVLTPPPAPAGSPA